MSNMWRVNYRKILGTLVQFGERKCARTLAQSVKRHQVFESTFDNEESDKDVNNVVDSTGRRLGYGHNVFVLQPDIVGNRRRLTTPALQLAESVALVESIPGWSVCGQIILPTRSPEDLKIFSTTRMENLRRAINDSVNPTALFVSMDGINLLQKKYLIQETDIENVFDRYTLVLEIFRIRAQTKQAKLQVALAEIPYLKSVLKSNVNFNRQGKSFHSIGGPGETPMELLQRQFKVKEQRIKTQIARLERKRSEHREMRKRSRLPVVAIVGYTNAGKTTVIKSLTKSEKLQPKNHLFATLDVTTHAVSSSGSINYLLVDTVGFLSDLPHALIAAFSATMEDMLQADLIVHVCDISHPDFVNQKMNVYKVLGNLHLPQSLLKSMIEVQNKVDLLPDKTNSESTLDLERVDTSGLKPAAVCRISATKGTGIKVLSDLLQEKLTGITGTRDISIRIPVQGDYLDWLDEYAVVTNLNGDGDYHFIVDISITDQMLNKFKSTFMHYQILL